MYASVGLGPVRVGGRISGGKRKPFKPGSRRQALVCAALAGVLCLALGMPWYVPVLAAAFSLLRNEVALSKTPEGRAGTEAALERRRVEAAAASVTTDVEQTQPIRVVATAKTRV